MIQNHLFISGSFTNFWTSLVSVITSFHFPNDLIDILVVAFIIYQGARLMRETRAMQLLKGIAAILIIYFISTVFRLITLSFFLRTILQGSILVLVVLFQPELRSALEKVGRTQFSTGLLGMGHPGSEEHISAVEELINVLVESCLYLSARKTGALIVVERTTRLGDVIHTGTVIDSAPSVELMGNIFFTNSPLHDGAMIIRDGRLHAAGCYLPLSQNMEIARELGTRHRAALGMSEVSDALVLVVSEETGHITLAAESRLQRGLSENVLRKLLHRKLLGPTNREGKEGETQKVGFWKVRKK